MTRERENAFRLDELRNLTLYKSKAEFVHNPFPSSLQRGRVDRLIKFGILNWTGGEQHETDNACNWASSVFDLEK